MPIRSMLQGMVFHMQFRQFAASTTAVIALGAAAFLYTAHPSRGSDHQDSPAVVAKPGADITDVFVFPSPRDPNKVVLAMDVIPLIPAGKSGNYSLNPYVLYQFKIAHGPLGTKAPADLALQFLARGVGAGQRIDFRRAEGANVTPTDDSSDVATMNPPAGEFAFNRPEGTPLGYGVTAFAGPRADPFFFDLFQFFTILPDRNYSNPRSGDMLGSKTPTFNGYASGSRSGSASGNYACSTTASTNALTQIGGGFNVVSIVVEVPRALLVRRGQSPIVHVWATASTSQRMKNGTVAYRQIELLSRPAVKELFETFADHAKTNAAQPYNDPTIANSIAYFMKNVVGRSPAISNVVGAVLYPNEMAADLSQPGPAAYLGVETGGATGGKFGGRALTDDVITTSLGAVFGNTVPALGLAPDDGKENTCLTNQHVTSGQGGRQTQAAYPFLAQPH